MTAHNEAGFVTPEPLEANVPGESPFAKPRNRTIMGKLALALSLVPPAAMGLSLVFQPG